MTIEIVQRVNLSIQQHYVEDESIHRCLWLLPNAILSCSFLSIILNRLFEYDKFANFVDNNLSAASCLSTIWFDHCPITDQLYPPLVSSNRINSWSVPRITAALNEKSIYRRGNSIFRCSSPIRSIVVHDSSNMPNSRNRQRSICTSKPSSLVTLAFLSFVTVLDDRVLRF